MQTSERLHDNIIILMDKCHFYISQLVYKISYFLTTLSDLAVTYAVIGELICDFDCWMFEWINLQNCGEFCPTEHNFVYNPHNINII